MSTTQNRLKTPDSLAPIEPDESVTPEESAALRAEKLADIQRAIAAGAYDSDELLLRAMKRMRDAVENGKEPQ